MHFSMSASYTITLVLEPSCESSTIDVSADAGYAFDVNYGSTATFTPSWVASEPTCAIEYTCLTEESDPLFCLVQSNADTTITFDFTDGTFSLSTTDQMTYPVGTYTITISG